LPGRTVDIKAFEKRKISAEKLYVSPSHTIAQITKFQEQQAKLDAIKNKDSNDLERIRFLNSTIQRLGGEARKSDESWKADLDDKFEKPLKLVKDEVDVFTNLSTAHQTIRNIKKREVFITE